MLLVRLTVGENGMLKYRTVGTDEVFHSSLTLAKPVFSHSFQRAPNRITSSFGKSFESFYCFCPVVSRTRGRRAHMVKPSVETAWHVSPFPNIYFCQNQPKQQPSKTKAFAFFVARARHDKIFYTPRPRQRLSKNNINNKKSQASIHSIGHRKVRHLP